MKQVEAVIFDWAGTTVDYGCMAPVHAMKEAFHASGMDISLDEIRKPMGLLKIDHISSIMNLDRVRNDFIKTHGRQFDQADIVRVYQQFENNIFSTLHHHTRIIGGILTVQDYLRSRQIRMGSTTGYTREMISVVSADAKAQGYCPDVIVSSDQVRHGRPYPYMLHHNLAELEVKNINSVIKVGDTLVDIQEGINAGCWSVGVIIGGSMLGLSQEEVESMPEHELRLRVRNIKYEMLAAGADYVMENIDELPDLIESMEVNLNHPAKMRRAYAA